MNRNKFQNAIKYFIKRITKALFKVEIISDEHYQSLVIKSNHYNSFVEKNDNILVNPAIVPIIISWEKYLKNNSYKQLLKDAEDLTLDTDPISKEIISQYIDRIWGLPKETLRNHSFVDFNNYQMENVISWEKEFFEKLETEYVQIRERIVKHYNLLEDTVFPNDLVINGGIDIFTPKVLESIKDGGTVMDCGAFRGETAAVYHEVLKPSRIIAFEPIPENFKILKENIDRGILVNFVTPINRGVYSFDGLLYFSNDQDSSRAYENNVSGSNAKLLKLNVRSIDSVVKEYGIDDIRLIKLDVEDSEIEALKGAKNTIEDFRPILFISIYHSAYEFFAARKLIENWNMNYKFILRDFDPTNILTELVLIAIPEELL
jgi:FkbM family methyltransferase